MLTWEKVPVRTKGFVPKLSYPTRLITFKHFLLIFNYGGAKEEKLLTFDLEGKRWLPTKLTGDQLEFTEESSICVYNNKTIIISGTSQDEKEGILNMLFLETNSNGN